ncbi:hypothetical protein MRX96_047929 [Rhipicephalus microplus]
MQHSGLGSCETPGKQMPSGTCRTSSGMGRGRVLRCRGRHALCPGGRSVRSRTVAFLDASPWRLAFGRVGSEAAGTTGQSDPCRILSLSLDAPWSRHPGSTPSSEGVDAELTSFGVVLGEAEWTKLHDGGRVISRLPCKFVVNSLSVVKLAANYGGYDTSEKKAKHSPFAAVYKRS